MHRACRNLGTRGPGHAGASAPSTSPWWDLKARLLDVPAGRPVRRGAATACRSTAPAGSPPSTDAQLAEQVDGWAGGRLHRDEDQDRRVLGHRHRPRPRTGSASCATWPAPTSTLMVDANGGYTVGQARRVGAALDELGVVWFEEPVSSDDLAGLGRGARGGALRRRRRRVRRRPVRRRPAVPGGGLPAARRHPLRRLHRLAARRRPRRSRTTCRSRRTARPPCTPRSPPPCPNLRHVEWFVDHARLEPLLVDGAPTVRHGALQPNDDAPGPWHDHRRAGSSPPGGTPPGHHDFGTPAEPPIGGSP